MKQILRPATAEEVREIVGPLDDSVLLGIVETDATPAEVIEAFTWATADDQIGTELGHGPRGAVARVYEIQKSEELDRTRVDSPPRRGGRCDGRCSKGGTHRDAPLLNP